MMGCMDLLNVNVKMKIINEKDYLSKQATEINFIKKENPETI